MDEETNRPVDGARIEEADLKVLILEDRPRDAELITRALRQGGISFSARRVETREAFLGELAKFNPELILADYNLPDFDGLSALGIVKERCPEVPFIFVTGTMGEEWAIETMRRGATDYVLKRNLAKLAPAVLRALQEKAEHKKRLYAEAEVRQERQEIAASEARLRLILERTPDALIVIDTKGMILFANGAAGLLFGRKVMEIIGADFGFPAIGEEATEIEVPAKDGSVKIVEMRTVEVTWEGKEASLLSFRDVTERKQTEEELIQGKNRIEQIMRTSPAGILVRHCDARVTFVNELAADVLDLRREDVINLGYEGLARQLLDDEGNPVAYEALVFSRVMKTGNSVFDAHFTHMTANNQRRFVSINGAPIFDNSGRVSEVVITVNDITELKETEEALKQSLAKVQKTLDDTIKAMATMLEARDPYTAGHQLRVAKLAGAIAEEMGLSEERCKGVTLAGMVHDIGKIYVPAEILSKPGKLNEMEFAMMKSHVQVGSNILKTIDFPFPIADIVYQHHERINGCGYPTGATGEDMLLEARILAVSDVVEAMASHRPYRPALGLDRALEEIEKNSGILYDTVVVDACLKLIREKGADLMLNGSAYRHTATVDGS